MPMTPTEVERSRQVVLARRLRQGCRSRCPITIHYVKQSYTAGLSRARNVAMSCKIHAPIHIAPVVPCLSILLKTRTVYTQRNTRSSVRTYIIQSRYPYVRWNTSEQQQRHIFLFNLIPRTH